MVASSTSTDIDFPIIDTHQHLWDLDLFKLRWLKTDPEASAATQPLGKSHRPHDYQAAAEGLGIVKSVYMEVDVVFEQQTREVEYVTALCEDPQNLMCGAVVSGCPGTPGFEKWASYLSKNRWIKGVRRVLHADDTPRGTCTQPEFIRSMQQLGEYNLSFDFCIRPGELKDAALVAKACPGTRFILDHCGNMPVHGGSPELRSLWQDGLKALADQENVVCKISGIVASTQDENWRPADLKPVIETTVETFGIHRVMFASDWPVCTTRSSLKRWISALKEIVALRPIEQQRRLFHDNALAFYGLAD